jgi:hypothetical protein
VSYRICRLDISLSIVFVFGVLRHECHARAHREMEREPMATALAEPEVNYRASRLFLADQGRDILARFFGVPDFVREELPLLGMEKLSIAIGIGALCDHGLFRLEMTYISYPARSRHWQ